MSVIADGLLYVRMVQDHGIIYAAGWLADEIHFEFSDDGGETAGTFLSAATRVAVATADECQPGIEILTTGEIVVSLEASGAVEHYVSRDHGETWAAIT